MELIGLSLRNVWGIKRLYETDTKVPRFLKQLVAEIPLGHTILIMQRVMVEDWQRLLASALREEDENG